MIKQMNMEQTIIRGYYALPAMIERMIVIDFLFLRLSEWLLGSSPQHCLYRFESDTGVNKGRCASGRNDRSAKSGLYIVSSNLTLPSKYLL